MRLWTFKAITASSLILSTGAVFGVLALAQTLDRRPARIATCSLSTGEVLVIVASTDGANVTATCQRVTGRSKPIATDAGEGPAILPPPPAGSKPASEATRKEFI